MLTGCCFEVSGFEKNTYMITCFATCAAYPRDHLSFDLPFRLREGHGGDRWNIGGEKTASEIPPAITVQALPFLKRMQSPQAFAEEILTGSRSIQSQRAAAVALASAGKDGHALAVIADLISQLNSGVPWQAEIGSNLCKLSEELEAGNAASLLANWERVSRERLKLI